MTTLDWVTIALYFGLLAGLTWWSVAKNGARGWYDYLQEIRAYVAPPIAVVFFFGVFMRRLTAGRLAALLTGLGMGVLRLLVDTPVTLGMPGYQNGYTAGAWLWRIYTSTAEP